MAPVNFSSSMAGSAVSPKLSGNLEQPFRCRGSGKRTTCSETLVHVMLKLNHSFAFIYLNNVGNKVDDLFPSFPINHKE